MKNYWFNLIYITTAIFFFNSSCSLKKDSKKNKTLQMGQKRSLKIPIGYNSYSINLTDNINEIKKLLELRWDKDNDSMLQYIGYSAPSSTFLLKQLKVNTDTYLGFNKLDSTLNFFYASWVFDNYERDKIIPILQKEISTRIPSITFFSFEEIKDGMEHIRKYNGYYVKIKFDTASYSPSFYYTISTSPASFP